MSYNSINYNTKYNNYDITVRSAISDNWIYSEDDIEYEYVSLISLNNKKVNNLTVYSNALIYMNKPYFNNLKVHHLFIYISDSDVYSIRYSSIICNLLCDVNSIHIEYNGLLENEDSFTYILQPFNGSFKNIKSLSSVFINLTNDRFSASNGEFKLLNCENMISYLPDLIYINTIVIIYNNILHYINRYYYSKEDNKFINIDTYYDTDSLFLVANDIIDYRNNVLMKNNVNEYKNKLSVIYDNINIIADKYTNYLVK